MKEDIEFLKRGGSKVKIHSKLTIPLGLVLLATLINIALFNNLTLFLAIVLASINEELLRRFAIRKEIGIEFTITLIVVEVVERVIHNYLMYHFSNPFILLSMLTMVQRMIHLTLYMLNRYHSLWAAIAVHICFNLFVVYVFVGNELMSNFIAAIVALFSLWGGVLRMRGNS